MHAGERENGVVGKPPRPGARKKQGLKGKKLFDKDSSSSEDEETPPASESEDVAEEEEDDNDDNTPLFHIRQTLHQPASMAGNSHLQPPPTAVKAQSPERSKRRDEGTPSLIRSAEEDEDTDTNDVLQTAWRESVVRDEPGLIGSATEEHLPVNIGQDHQTKHVASTGTFLLEESTKEDSATSSSAQENPSIDANSKGKRPASSDDKEGELAAWKRWQRDLYWATCRWQSVAKWDRHSAMERDMPIMSFEWKLVAEHAKELQNHLESVLANEPVTVKSGAQIVKVTPQGIVMEKLLLMMEREHGSLLDMVLCVGDDWSNEDMLESIESLMNEAPNVEVSACTIGQKPSKAKYYFDDTVEVIKMLQGLPLASEPSTAPSLPHFVDTTSLHI
ncbi:unnamed protein product [Sphagnum balticum]